MSSKNGSSLMHCEICKRDSRNEKLLGPFVQTKTIGAHYNCVIYCPVTPEDVEKDITKEGIGGVSTRFVRFEGRRAADLVCIFLFFTHLSIFNVSIISKDLCILQAWRGKCWLLSWFEQKWEAEILQKKLPRRLWYEKWSIVYRNLELRSCFALLWTSWPDRKVIIFAT